ncbi:hypothetical protein QUA82_09010 [Microcoleus sp. F8-D3]
MAREFRSIVPDSKTFDFPVEAIEILVVLATSGKNSIPTSRTS